MLDLIFLIVLAVLFMNYGFIATVIIVFVFNIALAILVKASE